jgi:F-type H+-transporting ATPase subunit gamma
MGNLREIRNRIGSVKNTRKITSAMSRIASARMVKAQQAATAARPYGARISEVVRALTGAGGEDLSHPLMTARPELRAVAVIVVTADRGLCGAFNGNVIKAAVSLIKRETAAGRQVKVITVGRKGASFLENAGYKVAFKHEGLSHEQLVPMAKAVGTEATGLFLPQEGAPAVDAVHLIFNFFKNVLVQETRVDQLLPFQPPETTGEAEAGPVFEPSRAAVLEHLLPVALESTIQQALLNSLAAELAARRTAMDAATDNASQLITELTLRYNRERQAAITKELMEIIGGAEALKG